MGNDRQLLADLDLVCLADYVRLLKGVLGAHVRLVVDKRGRNISLPAAALTSALALLAAKQRNASCTITICCRDGAQ